MKFLRAFAAARINTLILAVFDNDAVGLEALKTARGLALPENIRVAALPDIELARSYPTIGPQGMHEMDINGCAVSIELFLGRHNISGQDGSLIPCLLISPVDLKCLVLRVRRLDVTLMLGIQSGDDRTS